MTFTLSCADYSFPALGHREALVLIGMLGFDAADIGFFAGRSHVRPEQVGPEAERWGAVMGERCAAAGLRIADVFGQAAAGFEVLAANHPDPGRRAEFLEFVTRTCRFAAAAGAPGITLLPGVRFGGEDPARALARSIEGLTRAVEIGERYRLRVSVEPHVESIVDTPAAARELAERTPGLGLTVDYGHFTVAGFGDAEVAPLLPFARHVQVRGAAHGLLQAPAAENTVDFPGMLRALAATGYDGAVACEYVHSAWYGCDRVDNLTETVWLRDTIRAAAPPGRQP